MPFWQKMSPDERQAFLDMLNRQPKTPVKP
jgi:hypothetical protein